jgi:copper transporter 1
MQQMLFTWSTENLCIVFRGWRIHNTWTLFWSLFGIVALTAGYELVREISRRYETACAERLENMPRKFISDLRRPNFGEACWRTNLAEMMP